MIKHLWVILLLSLGLPVQGQVRSVPNITGVVIDEDSQLPIEGATVYLPELKRHFYADQEGNFYFPASSGKDLQLQVTAAGYRMIDTLLRSSADSVFRIQMRRRILAIQEVEVGGALHGQHTAISARLSRSDRQEVKGKSAAEVFGRLNGVSLLSSGLSVHKPVVHGLHSNRVLMLNQGVRHEGQQWGLEHAPELDPFAASEFELIKGAQAVRYGADALGGVLFARSNPLDPTRFSGQADLIAESNGWGGVANVDLVGGVERLAGLAWRLQGSGSRFGDRRTASYSLGNTGSVESNFSTTLQYHKNRQQWQAYYSHFQTQSGIFYGAHIGTAEDLIARLNQNAPLETYAFSYRIDAPKQYTTHDLAKLSYKGVLGNDVEIEAQYAWQRNHRREYDRRRSLADDVPMSDMILTSQEMDFTLKWANQTIGMQATSQVNNNVSGTGTTPFIPNYDQYGLGVFGIHQIRLEKAILEAGWRYDFRYFDAAGYRYRYHPDQLPEQFLLEDTRSFHNVSASLGLRTLLSTRWEYKSQLGLAWRAPNANELYSDGLHHGAAIYEVGSADLKSEQALKWTHAIQKQGDRWQLDADVYGQWIQHYIYASPHPDSVRQTIRGTFPVFSYQQDQALFYGMDLSARWTWSERLAYQLSLSVVRARNMSKDQFLPYIPADRLRQSVYLRPFGDDDGYFSLSYEFVAKQHRYEEGSDFAAPPPAYHLFHVYVTHPMVWGDHQLQLAFGIDNVFNRQYKDYMDRFRYYAHREGRNFRLSLHFKF